jgi:hypothetical protein
MSLEYNLYQNNIPIVEKYIDNNFISYENAGSYNTQNDKYNTFVLDNTNDKQITYVLRVYNDIKNYQLFACGGGGHGGLIYGNGGNAGNYYYINNLENNEKTLSTGSYLIQPGKCENIISDNEIKNKINNIKKLNSFYFKVYKYNIKTVLSNKTNLEYTPDFFYNYRKIQWTTNDLYAFILDKSDITDKTQNILSYTGLNGNNFNNSFTIEIIFYIKKNSSINFNRFTNSYYNRIIFINKNNSINEFFDTTKNNIYTAGNNDEVIIILLYPNSESIPSGNYVSWDNLFSIDYDLSKDNYYIYDFNNKTAINQLISYYSTKNSTNANTIIKYNSNPNASFDELKITPDNLTFTLRGGINAEMDNVSTELSQVLTNFYLPTVIYKVFNGLCGANINILNEVMLKLGYVESTGSIELNKIEATNFSYINNIRVNLNNNSQNSRYYGEWQNGEPCHFIENNFNLFVTNKNNESVPLNNLNICNGGIGGNWQLINNSQNYKYGANGLNDLNSHYYGLYGSGGQGGSLLIEEGSLFTGSKGKDGVFILSFKNSPISDIINNNSKIVRKMFNLYIKDKFTNEKFNHIIKLQSKNILYSNTDNSESLVTLFNNKLIDLLINNSFLYKSKIELNESTINDLLNYISRNNLTKLLGIVYIIQRTFYIIKNNINKKINFIDNNNEYLIDELNINFTSNENEENVSYTNYKNSSNIIKYVLTITLYDKINDANAPNSLIIGYNNVKNYFTSSSYSNYSSILSLTSINIIKENGNLYHNFNNTKNLINNSYCDNTPLTINRTSATTSLITEQNTLSDISSINFIVNTISYLFEIKKQVFNVNVNVVYNIYDILRLNTVVYAILYDNLSGNINYNNNTKINNIYNNLKNYNYSIKDVVDSLTTNSLEEQNKIKKDFSKNINKYDELYYKNTNQMNLLNSKRSYYENKYTINNQVKIILTIIYIIITILFLVFLYVSTFSSGLNIIPYLVIILLVLVIIIVYLNYFGTKNIKFKENFESQPTTTPQIDILTNDTNKYNITGFEYNNNKYKMIIVKDNLDININQSSFVNFILIGKGETASLTDNNAPGGTINIYNDNFTSTNLKEQKTYNIVFNNTSESINVNSLNSKTNVSETIMNVKPRKTTDNKSNIKIYLNNNDNFDQNPNNYKTLKEYNNDLNVKNYDIKEIINYFIANKNNINDSIYYGSAGNTPDNFLIINKINNPNSYGVGGVYNNIAGADITGNNGVCIIIYKEVEYTSLHLDMQTLINMYNNYINKYLFNKFNDLYTIDNNLIYKNTIRSFQQKYKIEESRNTKYNTLENNINDGSNQILANILIRYEIVKTICYIFIAFIILFILYSYSPEYIKLTLLAFFLLIIYIISNLFYNISIYTRKNVYKYYWQKPKNLNKLN